MSCCRILLSAERRSRLFGIPADRADMAKYYVLDAADLALILVRRRATNRLGFAVQLCLLRHTGAGFRPAEHPPMPMLAFVAEQLGAPLSAFTSSTAARRARHDAEIAGDDIDPELPAFQLAGDDGAAKLYLPPATGDLGSQPTDAGPVAEQARAVRAKLVREIA
jgi:hypothetical protein